MREPSAAEFESLARAVLARLPEVFARALEGVVLKVEEFATDEQLDSLGIADPYDLTGLYEGVALTERTQWDSEGLPPVITLFRQPLLAEMEEEDGVEASPETLALFIASPKGALGVRQTA